jgi:hypothetical protein
MAPASVPLTLSSRGSHREGHGQDSSARNALASCRSAVSKPSVDQLPSGASHLRVSSHLRWHGYNPVKMRASRPSGEVTCRRPTKSRACLQRTSSVIRGPDAPVRAHVDADRPYSILPLSCARVVAQLAGKATTHAVKAAALMACPQTYP